MKPYGLVLLLGVSAVTSAGWKDLRSEPPQAGQPGLNIVSESYLQEVSHRNGPSLAGRFTVHSNQDGLDSGLDLEALQSGFSSRSRPTLPQKRKADEPFPGGQFLTEQPYLAYWELLFKNGSFLWSLLSLGLAVVFAGYLLRHPGNT